MSNQIDDISNITRDYHQEKYNRRIIIYSVIFSGVCLILGIITITISYIVKPKDLSDQEWLVNLLLNLGAGLIGSFITFILLVFLIDVYNKKLTKLYEKRIAAIKNK